MIPTKEIPRYVNCHCLNHAKNDEDRLPHSTSNDEEESGFGWKAVVLGYACGTIFGILLGYNVFLTAKPR